MIVDNYFGQCKATYIGEGPTYDVIFYDTHLGPHSTIAERYAWGQLAIIFLLEANI